MLIVCPKLAAGDAQWSGMTNPVDLPDLQRYCPACTTDIRPHDIFDPDPNEPQAEKAIDRLASGHRLYDGPARLFDPTWHYESMNDLLKALTKCFELSWGIWARDFAGKWDIDASGKVFWMPDFSARQVLPCVGVSAEAEGIFQWFDPGISDENYDDRVEVNEWRVPFDFITTETQEYIRLNEAKNERERANVLTAWRITRQNNEARERQQYERLRARFEPRRVR